MTVVSSTRVLLGRTLAPADVVVDDGRIAAIDPHRTHTFDRVDLGDAVVAPGLVDIQVNGAFGIDLTSEPERLWELATLLPSLGLTAFCPTLITSPPGTVERALTTLADRPASFLGTEPLGLHLEGPMISALRAGAHPAEHIVASVDATGWLAPAVRMVTLAPEVSGLGVVADLVAAGVVVALGHTDADVETAAAAFDAGARHVTHLFSAMRPLAHRDPGVVAAALLDDRVTIGMIPDGIHTHPAILALVTRIVGSERLVATSDMVAALGMPPGAHWLGGVPVTSDGRSVRTHDGGLAGSVLAPVESVGSLAALAGLDLVDSLHAHASVPARLLGEPRRGHLGVGARADLVALGDGRPLLTMVAGEILHRG